MVVLDNRPHVLLVLHSSYLYVSMIYVSELLLFLFPKKFKRSCCLDHIKFRIIYHHKTNTSYSLPVNDVTVTTFTGDIMLSQGQNITQSTRVQNLKFLALAV